MSLHDRLLQLMDSRDEVQLMPNSLKIILWSFRKSRRLGKIGRRHILHGGPHLDLNTPSPIQKALADVLEIAAHDPGVQLTMNKWKASPVALERLYEKLIMSGAGQVRAGHFVAASALTFGLTLDYLFAGEVGGRSWDEMAYRMIRYFEKNETGMP